MAVEAARLALRPRAGSPSPDAVWFATAEPPYLEKTNAAAIHAALRLDGDVVALDWGGALRSGVGALRTALEGNGTVLVTAAGLRTGRPTSSDEANGGDGAAAFLIGDEQAGTVVAEHVASASATEEFLDRWRLPGDPVVRQWEERFGETRYLPLAEQAWNAALKAAALEPADVAVAIVTGGHERAVRALAPRLGAATVADDLSASLGNTGAAHAGLVLVSVLEGATPGQVVAIVNLADGVDVVLLRTTDAITALNPAWPVADQLGAGAPITYAKFLSWRRMLEVEPPNRPTPSRPSAPAAARSVEWKFGLVGSRDNATGIVHLPPSRAGIKEGGIDDMVPAPMADMTATVLTFTVDRLIYSESPPVVFAVLDFEGGGRFPCELTDVDAAEVQIGQRVEMTFRRLFTADGIHNYFWKARPLRH
jgi:3-hydroxy-3-methylglutaryl CoA synthase/uncharacterized OB-fold protein